jgi:tetratricopeptide (TPR) repeat protein
VIRPEDEPKINEMTFALRASKEAACILLVSFNDELLRRNVEVELKRRLEPEGFNFREYRVTEDAYRNLPIMLVDMKPQPGDIFLIFDLKKALPEVLEYLNYRREDFVEHNISAIFWLDEPTLTEIARKALDFYAFRALPVFEFNVDRSQDMVIPGRTTPSGIFIYSSLEELNDKIALREELLKDYLEKRPEDRSTITELHNELGILYCNKSQYDKSIFHYEEALELCKEIGNRVWEASVRGNIGSVYHLEGNLDKALEYYSQALEMHRRIGDVEREANVQSNIGMVHRDEGDLDKALEYHSQALEIHRRIGDVRGEAFTLNNMGTVYWTKTDLDKALEYASQSLDIHRRIGDALGEANALGNMGIVYRLKGDLDKALEYASQSLDIHRRIGDIRGEASELNNVGSVYQAKGDLPTALDYIRKALRILISIGAPILADRSYRYLRKILEQMEVAGMELSEEDRTEIAELTEEYEKLKDEAAGVRTP